MMRLGELIAHSVKCALLHKHIIQLLRENDFNDLDAYKFLMGCVILERAHLLEHIPEEELCKHETEIVNNFISNAEDLLQ